MTSATGWALLFVAASCGWLMMESGHDRARSRASDEMWQDALLEIGKDEACWFPGYVPTTCFRVSMRCRKTSATSSECTIP
jgi:hypothetical protein